MPKAYAPEPGTRHVIGFKHELRTYPVTAFYVLAFLISWAGFAPLFAASLGIPAFQSPLWRVSLLLPATGPALAALIVSSKQSGLTGATSGLRRNLFRAVSWRWLAVASLLPCIMLLAADLLARAIEPGKPPLYQPNNAKGIGLTAVIALCSNPWEEVGWRGFALPHLQNRFHPLLASAIVGALWAVWHLPLFFWTGSSMYGFPFWSWAIGTVGKSAIYAWLFNSSGRRLIVPIIFHIAINTFGAFFGIRSLLAESAVDLAVAALILLSAGPQLGNNANHP